MVKDPQDNSPELDLSVTHPVPMEIIEATKAFPEIEPIIEVEPEFKSTLTPEQIAAAQTAMKDRTYSQRHPELGKMVNCRIHGFRHREFEFGIKRCEQTFTYTIGGREGKGIFQYQQFREEKDPTDPEKVSLVPDLRTAIPANRRPTIKQQVGQAAFSGKRFNPHISAFKRRFAETVRAIFEAKGFNVPGPYADDAETKVYYAALQISRVLAARHLSRMGVTSFAEFKRRGLL